MLPQSTNQSFFHKLFWAFLAACVSTSAGAASTTLADAPIGATIIVPANVILALSVEWPTGDDASYPDAYSTSTEYVGYFNPNFCYAYSATNYVPMTAATTTHTCTHQWSGNFLNWALTQTIDPMRKALTGGYRSVDTAGNTVLQKASSDSNVAPSGFPDKTLGTTALVRGATPFNWSSLTILNRNTGLYFIFSSGTGTPGSTITSYPGDGSAVTGKNYKLFGAVQVCGADAASDLETSIPPGRCRLYPSGNYKPVGLMQKYAAESAPQTDSIRYSAFGYLNDSNITRDGGVMRSRMKSIGPFMATGNPIHPTVVNTAPEWSGTDGTFFPNPNNADATASGVTNSGVVNYLNKFGLSGSYKSEDPVGELYYAATRYYRKLGNVASYTSGATTAMKDNFPVINFTTADDPLPYWCSKNYIVGIGDIHTHADANLPGRTYSTANEPAMPPEVTADTVVNSVTATNWVAMLEHQMPATAGGGTNDYQLATGIGNNAIDSIAAPTGGWCCDLHSFLMAGLAYDLHTRDIRPDMIKPPSAVVNVSTFWVDVMENGDYHEKNQFWLTAKYGGFDTSQTDPITGLPLFKGEYVHNTPLPTAWWNTGKIYLSGSTAGYSPVGYVKSDGTFAVPNPLYSGYIDTSGNVAPDQYFQAANPTAMINGFNAAFAKIRASIPSGTSTALALGSSTIAATGNANYAVSFAKDWSGDVVGSQLAVTTTGGSVTTTSTVKWHAHDWLPNTAAAVTGVTPLTASTRIIATSSSAAAGNGVPFEITNISSAEKTTLGGTSTLQTDVLNYVRGDPSKEGAFPAFRPRTYTLGDITNSKPAVVAAPSFPYADSPLNPGYSTFVSANSGRGPVIYVGANDGMLHAFDASMTSATGGKELFAYVPSFLFNTNVDSQGSPVGLASLVANPLQHHFMVDAQPNVIDVDFARTRASGAAPASSVPSDWHTILTSGLGKGGNGYFTLDVTNPAAITTESAMAGKVLWEASYPHMGYSYGTPLVVKTANYGWTVVLTSGYNNDDGHGYIYLVSPKDGTVYQTLAMPDGGTLANPAGLAFVSGYINNYADYTADSLYAGDLLGNVWRVDLRASTFGAMQKFATLADSAGNPQPVTTEPVIATDPSTQTRYVFVGTGRLLADIDLGSSTQQTFYSFSDGNNAAFSTNTTTLTRSDLVDDSASVVGGVTVSAPKRGYFIDLKQYLSPPAGQQPAAERVNVQPVASGGVVSFAANLFGQDPCSTGSGRLFALGYDSGSGGTGSVGNSLLTGATGSAVEASVPPVGSGPITNVSIVATPTGMLDVLAGTGLGSVFGGSSIKPTKSLNKLNWREVPSVN
jgi:type IV pilus assembly protein PilY1